MQHFFYGDISHTLAAHQAHIPLDLHPPDAQDPCNAALDICRQTIEKGSADRTTVRPNALAFSTSVPRRTPPSTISCASSWIRSRIAGR